MNRKKAEEKVSEAEQPKKDFMQELREYPFDQKMLQHVVKDMKKKAHFIGASETEMFQIAAIIIKSSEEYKKIEPNKIDFFDPDTYISR